jgi:predicted phage terminase large subunit-like protein
MFDFTPAELALMSDAQLEQYTSMMVDKMAYDAEDSLFSFYKNIVWPAVEGDRPFVDNWHLRAMAEHLEAVTDGKIRRLLINVPFRTSKSTLVSVAWPAWVWIKNPGFQWLCGSYAEKLAIRDSLKMRRVITSPLFLKHWGDRVVLSGDQNAKEKFENTSGGYRQAFGFTSGVMGSGADTVLIDDPHDRQGANSEAERESTIVTFSEGIITRLNNPASDPIVMIMQRLHQNDLSGHVLKETGVWDHLVLPMRYIPSRSKTTSLGFKDPRTIEGELLWPERFPEKTVRELEATLGSYGASGQLQQIPSPLGGGILKTENFRLWPADKALPDLVFCVQSYDTAFTEKTSGDPTGCQVWGIFEFEKRRNVILLDCWNKHLGYPQLKQQVVEDWQARYAGERNNQMKPSRRADIILVEAKGSGQSLLQDLRMSNIPAVAYNPGKSDKSARAHMAAPFLENDVFWVMESPKHKGKPRTWVTQFFEQLEFFPSGEHDEMVDCFTQFVIYARDSGQLDMPVFATEDITEIDYEEKKRVHHRVNPYG